MSIKRIAAIDLLRGFFIFMIIVDHLEMFPSGYDFLTGRGLLWMSAAEGFFFLSGIMIGIVRGRKHQFDSFNVVIEKLLKRSLILYAWVVGLTLLFSFIAINFGAGHYIKPGLLNASFIEIFYKSISLQYIYTWSDFLRYYAVFLLASIPAIWLLRKNLAWVVGIISATVWAFSHSNPFFTWQILFFGGVIAGWYFKEIIALAKKIPRWIIVLHYPIVLTTLLASIVSVYTNILPDITTHNNELFLRASMPLPRLLIFFLWFSALFRIVNKYSEPLKRTVGRVLIPFGQNSLYAYILHGFIIFFAQMFILKHQPIIINFLVTTASLFIIWLAIQKKFLFGIIPR